MAFAHVENGVVTWVAPPVDQLFEPGFLEQVPDGAKEGDLWDGTTLTTPPPPPPPVPPSVSKLQLKMALGNQWAAVDAAIKADQALLDAWTLAAAVDRYSPMMLGAAQALGFTDAQIDNLFRKAAAITV